MLKIENTEVLGWEHAIRGMRNPLNSWAKSDSEVSICECEHWPHDVKKSFVCLGSALLVEGVRYLQGGDGG